MTDQFDAILPNNKEVAAQAYGDRYYGTDKITPDIAFEDGIPLKGEDRRLLEHVNGNLNSAFRGTTALSSINSGYGQGAAAWAELGGWVYHIDRARGWDTEKLLQGEIERLGGFVGSPHAGELEVAVPSRIEAAQIIKAGQVESLTRGALGVRTWQHNKNYQQR